jgi:predicted component of type VI protein secretion system
LRLNFLGRETRLSPTLGRYLYGRNINCDQPIDHPTISREHAEILYLDGQFVLRDFSTNGSNLVVEGEVERLHRSEAVLPARGKIYFGQTQHDKRLCVDFECISRKA